MLRSTMISKSTISLPKSGNTKITIMSTLFTFLTLALVIRFASGITTWFASLEAVTLFPR